MWDGRYHHSIVEDDPAIQIDRLGYVLSQGVKEGLVIKPADWPGVQSVNALLTGVPMVGLWYDRTAIWSARNRQEPFDPSFHTQETIVHFHPIPFWQHLPESTWRRRVREVVEGIEQKARSDHERANTRPAGTAVVLARPPHYRPRSVAWSAAPRILAASKQARWALWRALQEIMVAYGHAAEKLAGGSQVCGLSRRTFPPRRPYVPSRADLGLGIA